MKFEWDENKEMINIKNTVSTSDQPRWFFRTITDLNWQISNTVQ